VKSAKRIRILLTVPHLSRTASPYREMMAISKHLRHEEFDLTICALRDGGSQETGPLLDKMGIPWFVSLFRPRKPSIREFWLSHRAQKEISRRGPFDIQHSLDFTSSPAEALAARVRSRRYVYNQRNLNQNGHAFALRIKFLLSNRIVAIADHVRNFLLDHGAASSRLVRIYNGIDVEQVDLDMPPPVDIASRNLLLVLGNIQPSKRHEDIIRAMPLILERAPQMRLAMGGNVYNQPYLAELRQLAVQLKVEDKVDFLGGRSDVFELMRRAKALVLCSESEGLPWVILEAMAARLPVIVSDIEAHREIVDDGRTGLLARLGQPATYAAAVTQILDNPDFASRLASQARDRLEREFTAVTMVRQLEQMYREMMASRKSRKVAQDALIPNQMPHSQAE
jgi:glycosyltransferase involved in cell wall biosynthesis